MDDFEVIKYGTGQMYYLDGFIYQVAGTTKTGLKYFRCRKHSEGCKMRINEKPDGSLSYGTVLAHTHSKTFEINFVQQLHKGRQAKEAKMEKKLQSSQEVLQELQRELELKAIRRQETSAAPEKKSPKKKTKTDATSVEQPSQRINFIIAEVQTIARKYGEVTKR